MTNEDKTVKIKAKYDCPCTFYKAGDIFDARIQIDEYVFKDKYGSPRHRSLEEFTIIPDEPAIEVGSEWVSSNGVDWTVAYVGKYVIIKRGQQELSVGINTFKEKWKPKPKTVTMYFYRVVDRYIAYSYKQTACAFDFTREIELP